VACAKTTSDRRRQAIALTGGGRNFVILAQRPIPSLPAPATTSHCRRRMSFAGAIFESELEVRPDDLDLFRHVHSSRYLDYVLAARFDQMKRCYGMAMEEFLERGLGWVVRRSFIEYKRALKLGNRLLVRTRIEEFFPDGVKVWFEILRLPDRKQSCLGWCDYTLVTLADGRARALPEEVREKYSIRAKG
jgi:acyl-CoA thioester hydrolase/thioesterase-3